MLSFLQRHRGVIVVGVLLVLPLVLLYAQTRRGGARGPVVGVLVDVAGGIERGLLWVTGGIFDGIEHYVTSVAAWDELVALRRERVAALSLETRVAELSIENEKLRSLANAAAAIDGPRPLGARVIGRAGQPLTRVLIIDKGIKHGVRRGDGVIAEEGVVGVVLVVGKVTSEVLLLSDPSSAIDIVVQRSRARGILRGRGDDDRYAATVEDFDRLRDVRPGDVVVTSGFGARFPPGQRVGVVVDVKDRDELTLEALIQPSVALATVEHVAVLVQREALPLPILGDEDDALLGSSPRGGRARRPTPSAVARSLVDAGIPVDAGAQEPVLVGDGGDAGVVPAEPVDAGVGAAPPPAPAPAAPSGPPATADPPAPAASPTPPDAGTP